MKIQEETLSLHVQIERAHNEVALLAAHYYLILHANVTIKISKTC